MADAEAAERLPLLPLVAIGRRILSAADRGRFAGLRQAFHVGDLVTIRAAVVSWREAVLGLTAEEFEQRSTAKLMSAMAEADSAWREKLERTEAQYEDDAYTAAQELEKERTRREEEAALLRSEMELEQQQLVEAIEARRSAEADAAAAKAAAEEAARRSAIEVAAEEEKAAAEAEHAEKMKEGIASARMEAYAIASEEAAAHWKEAFEAAAEHDADALRRPRRRRRRCLSRRNAELKPTVPS